MLQAALATVGQAKPCSMESVQAADGPCVAPSPACAAAALPAHSAGDPVDEHAALPEETTEGGGHARVPEAVLADARASLGTAAPHLQSQEREGSTAGDTPAGLDSMESAADGGEGDDGCAGASQPRECESDWPAPGAADDFTCGSCGASIELWADVAKPAHGCRSCGKWLHSSILCSSVWMPMEGAYFCSAACILHPGPQPARCR